MFQNGFFKVTRHHDPSCPIWRVNCNKVRKVFSTNLFKKDTLHETPDDKTDPLARFSERRVTQKHAAVSSKNVEITLLLRPSANACFEEDAVVT
tara:strand:- start:1037 stop:1318 length:282 start_codon:yes stop_codon:yes gene_type:complete